ncbi:ABC transporter ATP-binding protein [Hathewaya proteolytica]|nr:ABC transporter ATP-binding protein [Hathewaya proteolytica]
MPRLKVGGFGNGHRQVVVQKPKSFKKTMMRVWKYFDGEHGKLLLMCFFMILSSLIGVFVPHIIGKAVDIMDVSVSNINFNILFFMLLFMVVAYVVDAALNFLQSFVLAGVSQRMVKNLRRVLFNKLQRLPVAYFDGNSKGDIMSRLANDIDNVSTTVSQSILQLMAGVISIVGSLIMMLYLSTLLTVATIITVPLVFFLTKTVAKKTAPLFRMQQRQLGLLNGTIEESVSGIYVVKSFGHEDKIIEHFAKTNEELCSVGIKAQVLSGLIMPLMNVINNIGFTMVAWVGGIMAVKGQIGVGIISSFIIYSKQFSRPLNDFANVFNTLQSAVAGAERVFEILDEAEEVDDKEGAIEIQQVKGDVEFKNVSFAYREDVNILNNVSFKVKAGSTIALVGSTGAGKTTIVNLLTRFYDVTEGTILIDGTDIQMLKRSNLRDMFGIVLQDTYLFTGTIKENIMYGNPEATEEQIKKAAIMANAHGFISRLRQGYNTMIYEGGSNLSQGERQLIAIARAILSNPSILILDEATSNVDTRTEKHIQSAMIELMRGRTSFIIAHRLSTIREADVIMVINHGEIIEQGSHDQLMDMKGFYYEMCMSQLENRYND